MTVWQAARMMPWSTKLVIAVALLAVLLVAALPVALFASVVMMLLGHIVGGLILFAASIGVATAAAVLAGMGGVRHVRKLVTQRLPRVVQLRPSEYFYGD